MNAAGTCLRVAALVALLSVCAACGSGSTDEAATVAPGTEEGAVDELALRPPDPGPGSGGNWISIEGMAADAIDVIWSQVDDVAAHELYRLGADALVDPGAAQPADGELIYRGPATEFTDREIDEGAAYLYMAVTERTTGARTAPRWREGVAVNDTTPPSAVGDLRAERTADGVRLAWTASADDYRFEAYDVRQRMPDGTFEWIGGAYALDQVAFLDDRADPAVSITYEVVARDFHGNRSSGVRVTVPPA